MDTLDKLVSHYFFEKSTEKAKRRLYRQFVRNWVFLKSILEGEGLRPCLTKEVAIRAIEINSFEEMPLPLRQFMERSESGQAAFYEYKKNVIEAGRIGLDLFAVPSRVDSLRLSKNVTKSAARRHMEAERNIARRQAELEQDVLLAIALTQSELRAAIDEAISIRDRANQSLEQLEAEFARRQAKRGGNGRAANYTKLEEEAHRLAREMVPGGGVWPSMRQCAKIITESVQEFAKREGLIPLSEDTARDRIAEWLGRMTERDTLFASKRGTSTGKDTASTS